MIPTTSNAARIYLLAANHDSDCMAELKKGTLLSEPGASGDRYCDTACGSFCMAEEDSADADGRVADSIRAEVKSCEAGVDTLCEEAMSGKGALVELPF